MQIQLMQAETCTPYVFPKGLSVHPLFLDRFFILGPKQKSIPMIILNDRKPRMQNALKSKKKIHSKEPRPQRL